MLKNYTVIVKNVNIDKRNTILKYLTNKDHKNHKNNTEIFEYSDVKIFEKITNQKLKKNEENYIINKKGGKKLKVVNKSLTFNLPKDYKKIATPEKCQEIYNQVIKKIIREYKAFGVEITEKELYGVLHYQNNPHIHLILPYLDMKGNTIREIKPKSFINRLKVIWSMSVDNVLNTAINDYKPLSKEEQAHNYKIRQLQDLKEWYITLQRIDNKETKYYTNQIKNIDRLLQDNKIIEDKNIELLYKNMNKAYDLRIKANMPTPAKPFI